MGQKIIKKQMFLEDLPQNKNHTIQWKNSVGYTVKFQYADIIGKIKILDYKCINKNPKIFIEYNGYQRWISVGAFKSGDIGEIVGKRRTKYEYQVGDIAFDQFLILEQNKIKRNKNNDQLIKGYVCKCLICNHIFPITETALCTYHICPACCKRPKKLVIGINDLQTKFPDIAKMLCNKEDGITHIYNSTDKVDWVCPICGDIIPQKAIDYVLSRGLKCPHCTDKHLKYPERVMFELLKLLNIDFQMHISFPWSKNKEYDFYIPSLSCIIETHGGQHYKRWGTWENGRTLEEEQENDIIKQKLALNNGIKKYIIIDCRYSDFNFIFKNILNSELNTLFDLSNLDLFDWRNRTCSNYVRKISEYWNNGLKTYDQLCEITKMSKSLIKGYLKEGAKLGLCDYDDKAMKKYLKENGLLKASNRLRIRCITDDIVLESVTETAKFYHTSPQTILRSCRENKVKIINNRELQFEILS